MTKVNALMMGAAIVKSNAFVSCEWKFDIGKRNASSEINTRVTENDVIRNRAVQIQKQREHILSLMSTSRMKLEPNHRRNTCQRSSKNDHSASRRCHTDEFLCFSEILSRPVAPRLMNGLVNPQSRATKEYFMRSFMAAVVRMSMITPSSLGKIVMSNRPIYYYPTHNC